jgi:hypothetical protein
MKNLQGHWLRVWDEERKPLSLVFWLTQKGDSSVSKVDQQLPYWIEALQGSEIILKQPLRKVGAQACE